MTDLVDRTLSTMGRLVSLQLWQLGAIKVSFDKPFRLVSGNYSPIYVNCRTLISSPAFVDLFIAAIRLITNHRDIAFETVAGGETAGIPFAAFASRAFGVPMIYVRKEIKNHGLPSQVEGILSNGMHVLLVEDLITDAGTKLNFIQGIQQAGGIVKDVVVVFDRLQGGKEALSREGIRLHALADMKDALAEAQSAQLISSEELESVRLYLSSPEDWHAKNALPFAMK